MGMSLNYPDLTGSGGTCLGYQDIHDWGLVVPLGDSGWKSGLHSQGELNLPCVRLVGCGVQVCRLLMERCLKFLPQLGQQMSLGQRDVLCCFHH